MQVASGAAAAVAAVAVLAQAAPSWGINNEQLLFLEARNSSSISTQDAVQARF